MHEEIKVSIILPSLNVAEYIRECMESVVHQSLQEVEIICVDAGSIDGTLEILREYAEKDRRIKLLISDKKSYGYQMNLGIKVASGIYVGIVETDDYVPRDMFKELYYAAEENQADFVKADFYRFTGRGDSLCKVLHRLTEDTSFYNRVINPISEQECFHFLMNTWSGIYRRDFLKDHQIWHNETPGASFQDTGFWFQTFTHAERAFFVNQGYYMNRRDNSGSSVFNKKKVFCVCDEYRFIEDILGKRSTLFRELKFTYTYLVFRAYKGTLSRITDEDQKTFLRRFSEDFRRFRDEGMLDYRMFSSADWNMLVSVMDDSDDFYEQNILPKKKVFDEIRSYDSIIIYGAGGVGGSVLHELTYTVEPANVLCFAVSRKEDQRSTFHGLPVYEIHELSAYRESSLIVIATGREYWQEIYETLRKLGFLHVIIMPESSVRWGICGNRPEAEEYPKKLGRWYQCITGEKLNLERPVIFQEKQQWLKLYDVTDLKRRLSDKVEMREWAAERIGKEYLVPALGVFDRAEKIEFQTYPDSFVLKLTHLCGKNIFVKDKKDRELFKPETVKRRLGQELRCNYAFSLDAGFDLIYDGVKPRILAEEVVEGKIRHDNYKFLCFGGEPVYIAVDTNKGIWRSMKRDIFDVLWNHIPATVKYPNADIVPDRPDHLDEMLRISRVLAEGFSFCVVQFFDTESGVLFHKIKFSFGNGVEQIIPESFSLELGKRIHIETIKIR